MYEYSTGALTFALGAGQVGSDDFSIGAKYSTDDYSVAMGYEDNGVDTQTVGFGFGNLRRCNCQSRLHPTATQQLTPRSRSSVDYAMDALTVTAFYTDLRRSRQRWSGRFL